MEWESEVLFPATGWTRDTEEGQAGVVSPETGCVWRAPGRARRGRTGARINAAGSGAPEANSKLRKTNVHSLYTDKIQNLIVMIKGNDL